MTEPLQHHPASADDSTWVVFRQDDNGNRFIVQSGLTREAADQMVAAFEGKGHKQFYWAQAAAPSSPDE